MEYSLLCDVLNESKILRDTNLFCTKVLKDESGRFIRQSAIHISWHLHMQYCWERGLFPIILAPWGHGKSVQTVIGIPLFWLGVNPDERIKIVCNSDQNAKGRVKSVSRYITQDKDFQRLFPETVPDEKESWTQHEIFIRRSEGAMSIDPSLQAKGIFSTGIGGRASKLLFDDIVDRRNAIEQPGFREKMPETFQDVWMSRLEPDGTGAYIATPWHQDDNTHIIMRDPNFCTIKQIISEDFKNIRTELLNTPDDDHPVSNMYKRRKDALGTYTNLPLWEEKWHKKALVKKCGTTEYSKRSFDLGFRLKPLSASDMTYPSFRNCIEYGISPSQVVDHKRWIFYTGVDLSSKKRKGNVIFTMGFNPITKIKIPVEIRKGAWTSPEVARQLAEVDRIYGPDILMVETNALQTALVEWIQECSSEYIFWDRVGSYQTQGNIKRSEAGLPRLETEFSNHSWRVLMDSKHPADCDCGFCSWINEMSSHPHNTDADCVMACWFAAEACREGISEEFYEDWQEPGVEGEFIF